VLNDGLCEIELSDSLELGEGRRCHHLVHLRPPWCLEHIDSAHLELADARRFLGGLPAGIGEGRLLEPDAIAQQSGNKSKPSIERYLRIIKKLEIIEYKGSAKKGGYFLTKKAKEILIK
jgi:hypothetical protein